MPREDNTYHDLATVGSNSSATHLSPEVRDEIEINKDCAIKSLKFNQSGSLLSVVESQSPLIKIISVPDGLIVCTLEPSCSTGMVLDVSFCALTNYCVIMYEHLNTLFLDLFNLESDIIACK